jgi:hypothetical protein
MINRHRPHSPITIKLQSLFLALNNLISLNGVVKQLDEELTWQAVGLQNGYGVLQKVRYGTVPTPGDPYSRNGCQFGLKVISVTGLGDL